MKQKYATEDQTFSWFPCTQHPDRNGTRPPADGLLSTVWRHQWPADRPRTSGAVRSSSWGARGVCHQGNIISAVSMLFCCKVLGLYTQTLLIDLKLQVRVSLYVLLRRRWPTGVWESWDWLSMLIGRLEATVEATKENSPQPSLSLGLHLSYSW